MSRMMMPQKSEGGQKKVVTTDWSTEDLLTEIIKQLKVMNLHLSLITGNVLNKEEVE